MRYLLALPLSALLATAIEFVHPKENSDFEVGEKVKVKWSSIDTDAKTLSLYLVNFVNFPPSYTPLAIDIDTDDGSHRVKIPCDTMPSDGYQINAINGTNVFVVYAQTPEFKVVDYDDDYYYYGDHYDQDDEEDSDFDSASEDGDTDSEDEDDEYYHGCW